MIFVKSILAGFLSLFVGAILLWVGFAAVFAIVSPPGREAVSIDVVSVCRNPSFIYLIIITSMFALGFVWEFRRLKRRNSAKSA